MHPCNGNQPADQPASQPIPNRVHDASRSSKTHGIVCQGSGVIVSVQVQAMRIRITIISSNHNSINSNDSNSNRRTTSDLVPQPTARRRMTPFGLWSVLSPPAPSIQPLCHCCSSCGCFVELHSIVAACRFDVLNSCYHSLHCVCH